MLVAIGLGAGLVLLERRSRSRREARREFSPFGYRLLLNRFYIDELYQFVIDKIVLALGVASSPCSTASSSTTPASTAPAS